MTPSDVLFQRAFLASLLVFALVGAAYFRLFGRRASGVVVRCFPFVGVSLVAAPIAFEMPLVAKALFWVLGFGNLLLCLFALSLPRLGKLFLKRKPRT